MMDLTVKMSLLVTLYFIRFYAFFTLLIGLTLTSFAFSVTNAENDAKAASFLKHVQQKYTASYIGTPRYWKERARAYSLYCPVPKVDKRCPLTYTDSHRDYINVSYHGLYDRLERLERGDKGGIARFFKVL